MEKGLIKLAGRVLLLLAWLGLGFGVPSVFAQVEVECSTTARSVDRPTSGSLVYVIPVHGEFEKALYLMLVRAVRQAAEQGARAIVLDMNSPGGRVDAALKIRDLLVDTKIPTYTYVNPMAISAGSFIAIATDMIVMGPNSSIGGALPITIGPQGATAADEKFISVFNAEMRKTAKTKGHPPDIAEAFSNPDLVIPGLKEKGKILTLDYDEATSVGLASYQSTTLEDMLRREGLGDARIETFRETPMDRAARFLSSAPVLAMLMLVGLGGIFLELKAPGVSLPGIVGLIAMSLYFFGAYLSAMTGYLEIILFVVGVILLIVEIYVIPGFGVAGVAGIVLIVASLFLALINFAPDQGWQLSNLRWQQMTGPMLTILAALLGMIPFLYLLSRLLPATSLGRNLVLLPEGDGSSGGVGSAGFAMPARSGTASTGMVAMGEQGEAITDLRPSGTALVGGRRVDVLTEGEYLIRGTPIEVVRVEGMRVFVRRA